MTKRFYCRFIALSMSAVIIAGCTTVGKSVSRQLATAKSEPSKSATPESPYRLVSAATSHSDDSQSVAPIPLDDNAGRTIDPIADQLRYESLQPRDANSLPNQFRDIDENELLASAMANSPVLRPLGLRVLENPSGVTTIYDRAITASDPFFGPQAALAEFDSTVSAGVNAQNNDRVFNNAISGDGVQELTQDLVNFNAGWQRRSRNGAIWQLNGLTLYDNNNRSGNSFPSYWETQLEAGVRQPLLQGAGKEFNEIAGPNARPGFNFSNGIIIAQLNTHVSDTDFELAVQAFVRDLYSAYWDLDRHYRSFESVLAARDLSYRTWQSVLAKSKARLAGGEANKEAQARAKYYRYCREVQIALGGGTGRLGLYGAERQLRQMIGLPMVDGQLLRPITEGASARFVFDYDLMISRAMASRSELKRQNIKVRQQQLRLVAAKNFLLPQMDLIGRYRLRGFGDDLTGGNTRFSSATRDFYSGDHQEFELGVEMGVAPGRRQARAAVRNATFQLAREQVVLREQQRSVEHQVSDAIAEVSSSYYSMQSATAQAEAARERLKASEALFAADKLQIEFLLDAQEEIVQAELQLAADQARYSLSLVSLHDVTGQLLAESGVHISAQGCNVATIVRPAVTPGSHPLPGLSAPVTGAQPFHPE